MDRKEEFRQSLLLKNADTDGYIPDSEMVEIVGLGRPIGCRNVDASFGREEVKNRIAIGYGIVTDKRFLINGFPILAGIVVQPKLWNDGLGTKLLDTVKELTGKLQLCPPLKEEWLWHWYSKNGFEFSPENRGMIWIKDKTKGGEIPEKFFRQTRKLSITKITKIETGKDTKWWDRFKEQK